MKPLGIIVNYFLIPKGCIWPGAEISTVVLRNTLTVFNGHDFAAGKFQRGHKLA